ncbi:MAG: PEGA domain-containing protein [Thermoguttaceae bacterium]
MLRTAFQRSFQRSFRCWLPSLGPLVVIVLCMGQTGCVQRRMMIRSNPPGALVYVDDYEIGVTPISSNFTYYGQRKIRLVKDGYETLTVMQSIPAPWYQIPPLDFVSENLVPGEIRDRQTFSYQLTPQRVVPTDQLLGRAESLRRGMHTIGAVGPLSPTPAFPTSPTMLPPEQIPMPQGIGGRTMRELP